MDPRANEPAAAPASPKPPKNQEPGKLPERIALDKEVRFILGRPNFWCAQFAPALRKLRLEIAFKAEDEQAVVIHWMLNLYFAHGNEWRKEAERILKTAIEEEKPKS